MFANNKFSKKHAPVFMDRSRFDGEDRILYSALKAYIMNDGDVPPQTLIALDMFCIPKHELKKEKHKTKCYDINASVDLTPEDVMELIRYLNKLLSAVFNEENYRRLREY